MTSSDGVQANKPKSSVGDTLKGILIFLLLIVGAGAGGYFFGTYQKFAPVQNVPPGTPGAVTQPTSGGTATTSTTTATTTSAPTALKKKYWIHAGGDNDVGYSITTFINGQPTEKIFTADHDIDITNLVKPGENKLLFDAKLLPEGMRQHKGESNFHLDLYIMSGDQIGQPTPQAVQLVKYTRTAAENEDHHDEMSFVTME